MIRNPEYKSAAHAALEAIEASERRSGSNLHFHYDQLTPDESTAVDYAYARLTDALKLHGVGIRGDDTAERVVDAIAAGVIASRGLLKRPVKPGDVHKIGS